jgi:hypothetical protein
LAKYIHSVIEGNDEDVVIIPHDVLAFVEYGVALTQSLFESRYKVIQIGTLTVPKSKLPP